MTSAATTAVRRGRRTTPPARWMTPTNLVRGRQLWDDGVTATDIAGALGDGCTKSALLGFAHRNAWPPRPSPLGLHKGEVVPRLPDKPHHKPVDGVPRQASPKPPAPSEAAQRRAEAREQGLRWLACRPQAMAVPTGSFRGCQFIAGDDRKTWKMCGCETMHGGPYCEAHRRRCYLRPGERAWMQELAA